jgi:hypothetical protein
MQICILNNTCEDFIPRFSHFTEDENSIKILSANLYSAPLSTDGIFATALFTA